MRRIAVDALIVLESFLIALLLRFEGSVPGMYWYSFWPFAVLSVVVFVVLLQRERVGVATLLAAGILIAANMEIEVIWLRPAPNAVILLGLVLAFAQLVVVRRIVLPYQES